MYDVERGPTRARGKEARSVSSYRHYHIRGSSTLSITLAECTLWPHPRVILPWPRVDSFACRRSATLRTCCQHALIPWPDLALKKVVSTWLSYVAELSLSSIFLHCIQNRWLWLDFPEALELDRRGVEKTVSHSEEWERRINIESANVYRLYYFLAYKFYNFYTTFFSKGHELIIVVINTEYDSFVGRKTDEKRNFLCNYIYICLYLYAFITILKAKNNNNNDENSSTNEF